MWGSTSYDLCEDCWSLDRRGGQTVLPGSRSPQFGADVDFLTFTLLLRWSATFTGVGSTGGVSGGGSCQVEHQSQREMRLLSLNLTEVPIRNLGVTAP